MKAQEHSQTQRKEKLLQLLQWWYMSGGFLKFISGETLSVTRNTLHSNVVFLGLTRRKEFCLNCNETLKHWQRKIKRKFQMYSKSIEWIHWRALTKACFRSVQFATTMTTGHGWLTCLSRIPNKAKPSWVIHGALVPSSLSPLYFYKCGTAVNPRIYISRSDGKKSGLTGHRASFRAGGGVQRSSSHVSLWRNHVQVAWLCAKVQFANAVRA